MGIGKILCWELNPWSVEGLQRGAEKNGWQSKLVGDEEKLDELGLERLIVFRENNEKASQRIHQLRANKKISPVRHVNCGLLPTSRACWETAFSALDPQLGGWLHVHENVADKDVEDMKFNVVEALWRIGLQLGRVIDDGDVKHKEAQVHCQHVERVKSYAPGVVHCVYDIIISPLQGKI
jgi:tRNA wybutosine-synthesizing protein 2